MSDSNILKKIKLKVLRKPELVVANDVGEDDDQNDLPVFTHLAKNASESPLRAVRQLEEALPESPRQTIIEPDDTPKIHKASSTWEYFGARFSNFFVDFAISLIGSLASWLALGLISRDLQAQVSPAFYFITIFFTVHLYMTLRGRNLVGAEYKMHVVDKRGKPLTWLRALVRTILVVLTLPLLPLNVIFLSVGSRKLLHDHVCGTHVLHGDEDLKKSFYPPSSKWMAVVLVIFAIICAGVRFDFATVVERFASKFAEPVFGEGSKPYFLYLREKLGNDIPVSDWKDAKQKLPQLAQLADLQMKYEGADNVNTARATLTAAIVAVYVGDAARASRYIDRALNLPEGRAEAVLDRFEYAKFGNTNDLQLFCAKLYIKSGQLAKAVWLIDRRLSEAGRMKDFSRQSDVAIFLANELKEAGGVNLDERTRKNLHKRWHKIMKTLKEQDELKGYDALAAATQMLGVKEEVDDIESSPQSDLQNAKPLSLEEKP